MNAPAALSLVRAFLSIPGIFFIYEGMAWAAFMTFVVGQVLDIFDGLLARFLKQESEFGHILDQIADKVLIIFFSIGLYHLGAFPLWLLLSFVVWDYISFPLAHIRTVKIAMYTPLSVKIFMSTRQISVGLALLYFAMDSHPLVLSHLSLTAGIIWITSVVTRSIYIVATRDRYFNSVSGPAV